MICTSVCIPGYIIDGQLLDCFTVSLHSSNGRQMPAIGAGQGDCGWPLKHNRNFRAIRLRLGNSLGNHESRHFSGDMYAFHGLCAAFKARPVAVIWYRTVYIKTCTDQYYMLHYCFLMFRACFLSLSPYDLRTTNIVQPKRNTTTHGLRSFSYLGSQLWSNLVNDFSIFMPCWLQRF